MLESYFNLQFTLISFSYVLNFSSYSKWTANSKYESWWKLWMEVYHCINMIIMVIQFPRVTFCFAWSYFNLQFTLISFSYVLNFSSYSKWTANSKYESWWKLWMEVYHCINMIIMVIQFPRVHFVLLEVISTCHYTLIFKFHLIYCTNCKFKVRKLVKAINVSVSLY